MANLKNLWLFILFAGTIFGFLLALTNLYIPKSDKAKIKHYRGSDLDKIIEVSEKHRYGISFYFYYPVAVGLISLFSFFVGNRQSISIGSEMVAFAAIGFVLLIIYTFASCALLITIESMMHFFIKTHYMRKYQIVVNEDPKFFNEEEETEEKSPV